MVTIRTDQALSAIKDSGLLTDLLDKILTSKIDIWGNSPLSIPPPFIDLPIGVVGLLFSSKNKSLHLGTVLLAIWLDKPRTYNKVRPYLHMFSDREIDSAIRYAVRLGVRKSLRSKPSIGYAYRRKAKQRVV